MREKYSIDVKHYDFKFVKLALLPHPHIPLSQKNIL